MNDRPYIPENEIAAMMHKAGIRLSVHRIAILSYVGNSRLHPSVEEIYRHLAPEFPSLSRATVYNSLHVLVDKGLVREIEIEKDMMRYDMESFPHAHFRCRDCGRIIDVPMNLDTSALPHDYCVDSVDVYYKGLCSQCNHTDKPLTTNKDSNERS